MLYSSLTFLVDSWNADVVFVDGVSAPIHLLRFFRMPVLYYCHFPDKMLCVDRCSLLKRLYRRPLDWIERKTTGLATVLAVSSEFTSAVVKEAFPQLSTNSEKKLLVLYPPINFDAYKLPDRNINAPSKTQCVFFSLNRFEHKKRVALAIEALDVVHCNMKKNGGGAGQVGIEGRDQHFDEQRLPKLIIAGGCDNRVGENVEYLEELESLAARLGLQDYVSFRPNVSDEERACLLRESTCILYTPDGEHFGIVPVEAMYVETPVIAVASGGPLESIVASETGFLCKDTPDAFAVAMLKFVNDSNLSSSMAKACHSHVKSKFGFDVFGKGLETALELAIQRHALDCSQSVLPVAAIPLLLCLSSFLLMYMNQ